MQSPYKTAFVHFYRRLSSSLIKRILIVFCLMISFGVRSVEAQTGDIVLSQIKSAILSADAAGLADQTLYSVEIGLFGVGRYYSKGQATLLLKSFFSDFPLEDFSVTGSTRTPGAWFVEGKYLSKSAEKPIRIYIRLRVSDGTWKVREFLVEESDG